MIADGIERRTFAEELAVEAGKLASSYSGQDDLEVRSKGVLDWVTEADLATERLIRRRIGEPFPYDRILGEEEGDDAPPIGAGHKTWVVDPIDGTTSIVNDSVPLPSQHGATHTHVDLIESTHIPRFSGHIP